MCELTSVKMLGVLAMHFKKREKSLLPQSSEHLITPQLQLAARTGPGTQQLLEIRSMSCLSRDFQHISAQCGTGYMLRPQHPAAQPLLSPLLTHPRCSMGSSIRAVLRRQLTELSMLHWDALHGLSICFLGFAEAVALLS